MTIVNRWRKTRKGSVGNNAAIVLHFKRAGVISGPSRLSTRHSDLSNIKAWLFGDQISFGYRAYNNFGSAVHEAWLLNRLGAWKLTPEEKERRSGMIEALKKSVLATKLLADCPVREKRIKTRLNGVLFGGTPDARGKLKVIDLKTTICKTLKAFVESAFKYGYYRQGKTYMLLTGAKEYYIVGIQKEFPFNVYIIWLQSPEFRDWMKYVEQELDFLLYFYQNYGSPKYV